MKKLVVILGAGESGVGAALLARAKAYVVFVSAFGVCKPKFDVELERADISFEEKTHAKVQKMQPDVVVKSPGIPESAAVVKYFVSQGVAVVSEIQFAADHTQSYLIDTKHYKVPQSCKELILWNIFLFNEPHKIMNKSPQETY